MAGARGGRRLLGRPQLTAGAAPDVALGSVPLCQRRRCRSGNAAAQAGSGRGSCPHTTPRGALGRRWRRAQGQALARSALGGGPDGAAARLLRLWSVRASTADRFGGQWDAFDAYCRGRGRCSLPATTATIVEYVGHQWRCGSLVAASLKPMLAAVRKRHLGAGYGNPCDAAAVREAKAGFRRAGLLLRAQTKPNRIPLPSTVVWRLAMLACYSLKILRHRLTAVVFQFWWMQRAGDITGLCVADVQLPADGRTSYQVPDHKTAPRDRLIARTLPPAHDGAYDVPRQLLARLLADLRSAGASAGNRLFNRCAARAASGIITCWLRDGLARLGVTAPVGTIYSSHSLKKGGATAANAADLPRDAIAELANTTERMLAESSIATLVVPSCSDRFFFGRLLPA